MVLDRQIKIVISGVYSDAALVTQAEDNVATQAGDLVYVSYSASDFKISEGTLNLEEVLCDSEFTLGEVCSSKFEVELFNLNTDVSGRTITVSSITNNVETPLFYGVIESSEKDNYSNSRKIVAYDSFYYNRSTNVAEWWTDFWNDLVSYTAVANPTGNPHSLGYYELSGTEYVLTSDTTVQTGKTYYTRTQGTTTMKQIRESLCTYMGYTNMLITLPNDSLTVGKYNDFTSITFEDVLRMICETQACIPHINRSGNLEFKFFELTTIREVTDYEKNTSTFEDFTTQTITGINIYNGSGDFTYNYGTTDNAYVITSNIFLMSLSQTDLDTACNAIHNKIVGFSCRPCDLNMIVSDFGLEVGYRIDTNMGTHYIMSQTFSGSLFVDQEIECKAYSEALDQTATDMNNDIIEGKRWSSINQTVDEINLRVSNVQTNLEGQISTVQSNIEQTARDVTIEVLEEEGVEEKLTSLTVDTSGVTIKTNTGSADTDKALKLTAAGMAIINTKDNSELASFTSDTVKLNNWTYQETRSGNCLNIFKGRSQ